VLQAIVLQAIWFVFTIFNQKKKERYCIEITSLRSRLISADGAAEKQSAIKTKDLIPRRAKCRKISREKVERMRNVILECFSAKYFSSLGS
jgi:hypothetical protein